MIKTSFTKTALAWSLVVGGAYLAAAVQAQPAAVDRLPELPVLSETVAVSADNPSAIRVLLSSEIETVLVAQVAGNVSELQAGLGATVEKGQVILRLNCAETDARLRMSQAENRAARETLGVKQRLQKLDAAGDMEVNLARAEMDRTTAAIAVSRAQLDHCVVKAPFDGRMVKVHVKQHQGVSVGAPLVELVSDGPLKLRLNVPSRLIAQMQVGTPLTVAIHETGKSYPATVTAVNARVDAVAQTIELEAHLTENYPELLSGMSGVAQLPAEIKP